MMTERILPVTNQTDDSAKIERQENEELLPEGYSEALKDCSALATNLLSQAINGEIIKRCWDCSNWVGRCLKGQPNRIAHLEACSYFSQLEKR